MFGWFVGVVVFAVVISSDALSQQSFQQFESMSQFEQALAAVDEIKHRKQLECVLAIAKVASSAKVSGAPISGEVPPTNARAGLAGSSCFMPGRCRETRM